MAKATTKSDPLLQNLKDKSEDDYEKNLTYISAGSLGITMAFLKDVIDLKEASYFILVILAWSFFALTLISNLCSHLYSSYIMDKCQEDLGKDCAFKNWKRRTTKIMAWNIANVFSLMLGIGLFVIFISINISTMSKGAKEQATQPMESIEKHGRTPPRPDTVKIESPKPQTKEVPKKHS